MTPTTSPGKGFCGLQASFRLKAEAWPCVKNIYPACLRSLTVSQFAKRKPVFKRWDGTAAERVRESLLKAELEPPRRHTSGRVSEGIHRKL